MEAEVLDLSTDQLREALRRARIDVDAAARELQGAKFVAGQIALGVRVVHEARPDVAAAESRQRAAQERVAEIERAIADMEAEAAAAEAERAAEAATTRAEAVRLAEAELLDARRAADRALLARLEAAGGKGNDKTYAAAVAEHRAAAERVAVAVATLEDLEGDDE